LFDNDSADSEIGELDFSSVTFVNPPEDSTLSEDGKTLTLPNEGTWVLDPVEKDVTFTPVDGFMGDPTPVYYTIKDTAGNISPATEITVAYGKAPIAMPDGQANPVVGSPTVIDVLVNDTNKDIDKDGNEIEGILEKDTVKIEGTDKAGDPLTVDGEGAWSINATTGAITFTPSDGFIGDPQPIKYTVEDTYGNESTPAKVTVTYGNKPVAVDDSLHNPVLGTATTVNTLGNDSERDCNTSLTPSSVKIVVTDNPT
jgi:CshA-type fibril repeat protein